MNRLAIRLAFALLAAALAACSSDEYSGRPVSTSTSFYYGHAWYDDPDYWYDDPDYVVVPPDRVDRPVRPEQPIARPSPQPPGVSTLPAPVPERPATRPAPSDASRSRMPSAQPRMSSRSSRASIPRAPRGGGVRRR